MHQKHHEPKFEAIKAENGHPNYPNGIWFGTVDGIDCTGPCESEGSAEYQAVANFNTGVFREELEARLRSMVQWVDSDVWDRPGYQREGMSKYEFSEMVRKLWVLADYASNPGGWDLDVRIPISHKSMVCAKACAELTGESVIPDTN